jgi:hypothetical protein
MVHIQQNNLKAKGPLVGLTVGLGIILKLLSKEIIYKAVFNLARDRIQWCTVVNTAMNLLVP